MDKQRNTVFLKTKSESSLVRPLDIHKSFGKLPPWVDETI